MSVVQSSIRKALVLAATAVAIGAVTGCHKKASGVNPVAPYVISFILNLVIAFVLAQLCAWRNANTAARGAALGVLIWIGFLGPVTYTTYMYEMRPKQLFAINEFYPLVGLCLMGAILGAWTRKTAA